jgi:hypothetical protein
MAPDRRIRQEVARLMLSQWSRLRSPAGSCSFHFLGLQRIYRLRACIGDELLGPTPRVLHGGQRSVGKPLRFLRGTARQWVSSD